MNHLIYKSAVVIVATITCASIARANVVAVDAQANIYGARHATAPASGGGSAGILLPSAWGDSHGLSTWGETYE